MKAIGSSILGSIVAYEKMQLWTPCEKDVTKDIIK